MILSNFEEFTPNHSIHALKIVEKNKNKKNLFFFYTLSKYNISLKKKIDNLLELHLKVTFKYNITFFLIKFKSFSRFDVCLRRCEHQTFL